MTATEETLPGRNAASASRRATTVSWSETPSQRARRELFSSGTRLLLASARTVVE